MYILLDLLAQFSAGEKYELIIVLHAIIIIEKTERFITLQFHIIEFLETKYYLVSYCRICDIHDSK